MKFEYFHFQSNLPLATGDLEWADSVTEKPSYSGGIDKQDR